MPIGIFFFIAKLWMGAHGFKMTTIPLAAVKVWRVCFTTTDAGLIMVTKADEEIECLLGLLLEVTVWLEVYFADFM